MPQDYGYRVYRGKRLFNLRPLVILAAGMENDNIFYAECFILIKEIDGQPSTCLNSRIRWRTDAEKREHYCINEEFMFENALLSAENTLADYLLKKSADTNDLRFLSDYFELVRINDEHRRRELYSSYQRGEFKTEFSNVCGKSNSNILGADLGDIINFYISREERLS
jgi:hypothetical protein